MKISETTFNCCKPNRFISFKGDEHSESSQGNPRYKRYTQMSDDVLSLRSIVKAHNDVQKSGKMRMFKAMPYIATGLLGTTIALTQPGKLAAKAASGLGFLAISKIACDNLNCVDEIAKENQIETKSKTLNMVGKIGCALTMTAATLGLATIALKAGKNTKIAKFFAKETSQLAKEINATKLGGFVEKTVNPFLEKHKLLSAIAPHATAIGSLVIQSSLADSLSSDIKNKACENFAKGKYIQEQARAHFDSIDAVEV